MPESNSYLETQVMTASPYRLHLMTVDGAIRFAKQAEEALQKEDRESAHLSLGKSREFVNELISGLDSEHAPELVEQLKALFVFVYRRLAEADMHQDASLVGEALEILGMHRRTWVDLMDKLHEEQGDESTAVPHQRSRSWTT